MGHARVCRKIAGFNQDKLSLIQTRATKKTQSILNHTHHIFTEYKLLPSARRYALPRCRANRSQKSFAPITSALLKAIIWMISGCWMAVTNLFIFLSGLHNKWPCRDNKVYLEPTVMINIQVRWGGASSSPLPVRQYQLLVFKQKLIVSLHQFI